MRKIVLTAVTAAGVTVAGLVPALAAPASARVGVPVVVVTMSDSAIHVAGGAKNLPAGTVDFHIVSTDGHRHEFQLIRLHKGYSEGDAFRDQALAFNKGDAAAVRRLDRNVTFFGAAAASPSASGELAVSLPANRYLALDVAHGHATKWLLTSGPALGAPAKADGSITAFTFGFGNITPGPHSLPAGGLIRMKNRSDQPHMFVFQHVAAGTTPAMVGRWVASGGQQGGSFVRRGSDEGGVVSPYHTQFVRLHLRPGKYLVMCFWPDFRTGMPHAFMGMWKLVDLR